MSSRVNQVAYHLGMALQYVRQAERLCEDLDGLSPELLEGVQELREDALELTFELGRYARSRGIPPPLDRERHKRLDDNGHSTNQGPG